MAINYLSSLVQLLYCLCCIQIARCVQICHMPKVVGVVCAGTAALPLSPPCLLVCTLCTFPLESGKQAVHTSTLCVPSFLPFMRCAH